MLALWRLSVSAGATWSWRRPSSGVWSTSCSTTRVSTPTPSVCSPTNGTARHQLEAALREAAERALVGQRSPRSGEDVAAPDRLVEGGHAVRALFDAPDSSHRRS